MAVRLGQLLFLLCLFQVYSSGAQESMMSDISYPYLEKLIVAAKTNYPRIKMYNDKVLQAKTGITKAQLGWFNALNFTYLYSPNNSSTAIVNPTLLDGYQLGVYLNIGALLVTSPTVKIARQELNIALDNQAEYDLNIEAVVKQRYFEYVKQIAILSIQTKNAESIGSSLQQMKYKFEKGEESLDDYNKGITFYAAAVQAKIGAEGQVLVAKSSLEEIIGEKLEDVKIMGIKRFINLLKKHKYTLIGVPLLVIAIAFVLLRKLPDSYISKDTLSAGLADQSQQLLVDKLDLAEEKTNQAFTNLIQMMQMKNVFDQLSYQLILHDLTSDQPFRKPSKLLGYLNPDARKHAIEFYTQLYNTMRPLDLSNNDQKGLYEVIASMGYDYGSLSKKMKIYRVENSDFISVEFESDSPNLSAFAVNTLCKEFIIYYSSFTKENEKNP